KETKFEGNRAEGATGGAINADSSTVRLTNCSFSGNSAAVAGGAIAVMDSGEVALLRTRFVANHAATGGAVLADHSTLNVSWCIFDHNRCTATGAAIQVLGRRVANMNPIITNNTFYRNGGAGNAAAMYCQQVSPEIEKNIFVTDSTNAAVMGFESSPRYSCNLLHTIPGPYAGPLPGGNAIVGDPHFCDPENGDFHVRELSPALNGACGQIGAQSQGCRLFKMLPSK
ncbi:MAG TPA: right-handed parallel beta-helix repeat-containing protein, partial [Thermoplasmata archaeon]|nr:right-handed parallel beta-helix repeat-containing protein [Thermoplasmata archaeon]